MICPIQGTMSLRRRVGFHDFFGQTEIAHMLSIGSTTVVIFLAIFHRFDARLLTSILLQLSLVRRCSSIFTFAIEDSIRSSQNNSYMKTRRSCWGSGTNCEFQFVMLFARSGNLVLQNFNIASLASCHLATRFCMGFMNFSRVSSTSDWTRVFPICH